MEKLTTNNKLGEEVHRNAMIKGFYDKIRNLIANPGLSDEDRNFIVYLWRANRIMLMVSELAEGFEGLRKNNVSGTPKSDGLLEELADCQIRMADFATDECWDLDQAIADKHEFNQTRPYMHGGKVA